MFFLRWWWCGGGLNSMFAAWFLFRRAQGTAHAVRARVLNIVDPGCPCVFVEALPEQSSKFYAIIYPTTPFTFTLSEASDCAPRSILLLGSVGGDIKDFGGEEKERGGRRSRLVYLFLINGSYFYWFTVFFVPPAGPGFVCPFPSHWWQRVV